MILIHIAAIYKQYEKDITQINLNQKKRRQKNPSNPKVKANKLTNKNYYTIAGCIENQ
jgi:hypothetical protein